MSNPKTKPSQLLAKICNLINRGMYAEAEGFCEEAFDLYPENIDVLMQCGRLRYGQGQLKKATELLEKGFELAPQHEGIRTMLFASYKDNNCFDQMIHMANLFKTSPLSENERALAYSAYLRVCDWHSAQALEKLVLSTAEAGKVEAAFLPALLLTMNGIADISSSLVFQLHRQWAKVHSNRTKSPRLKRINGRIRIAYVSGDFFRHPVGYFMHQIIASHNRDEFEVFCYAHLAGRHDDVTELFERDADHFIDITNIDNNALSQHMHQHHIHIAVDLATHTSHSRITAFAMRLAPVQISYLGYPNTSGLTEMDYHITDHFAQDTKEGTKYTEKLLFMPNCFLCYAMAWDLPIKETSPSEDTGIVTFASFNDSRKLNLNVIAAWSSILQQVENSRLLLKFVGSENILIRENLLKAFVNQGIATNRIEFLERTSAPGKHILAYHKVDISLDPFPYTGTTTTCESLSQGAPVITLLGATHANRVSYSIMKNIGFEETIAYSVDEYIDKAVNLANNPKGLSVLRGCLPLLLKHSPLGQTQQFVLNMESLYKEACIKKGIKLNLQKGTKHQSSIHADIPRKLHIGGQVKHPEWEVLDANASDIVDHIGNANDLSMFEDHTFDAIYTSHVLEHFSYQKELANVLKEWYRVIKPGGILYASVPNLEVLCQLFLMKDTLSAQDRYMVMRMIFGGQIDPYDFHKVGYNEEILSTFLSNAGFQNIERHENFGLFQDTSSMVFNDMPISLNLTAIKPS